jgi:hypothetical protein
MEQYYYNFGTGESYTAAQMRSKFGIDPETTNIEVLNNQDFYPEQASTPDFDVALYEPTFVWVTTSLVSGGEGAIKSYTAVALPLPEAKDNASAELSTAANLELDEILCDCGINNDVVTAVASQDVLDRPSRFQDILTSMTAVTDTLDSNLTAVDNATSVDEIDSIIQQPSGTFVSGRGGAGPDDMHPSYFSVLTNLPPGIGEPELEIYIPGTNTVIPYNPSLPAPSKFDSAGNCYNTGDYRTTIRVAATGQVLSTVTPAFGPIVPINWTYNPTIPSLGGGSSSSRA